MKLLLYLYSLKLLHTIYNWALREPNGPDGVKERVLQTLFIWTSFSKFTYITTIFSPQVALPSQMLAQTRVEVDNTAQAVVCWTDKCLEANGHHFNCFL